MPRTSPARLRVLISGFDGDTLPPPATGVRSGAWRRFLLTGGALSGLVLVLVAARVAWFDAYWLFRADPPWIEATDGGNRLLDRQTRRSKTLQALTRDYALALVGSSTVYHGLDPRDVEGAFAGKVYNAGISAVIADELPAVASLIASKPAVERVVLGLDYYMFARADVPVRVNGALATATGRWNARLGSLLGEYAIQDSWLGEVAGGGDPGGWTREGFRITPPLPPAQTRANDATRRLTTVAYRPETLAHLNAALKTLDDRAVDVYLSPVSDAQRRVMFDKGLTDDFARWRADVARVVARHGARFQDLADLGEAFPFDPADGSTDHWLDNLHYTPHLGRLVLQRVGLRGGTHGPKDSDT